MTIRRFNIGQKIVRFWEDELIMIKNIFKQRLSFDVKNAGNTVNSSNINFNTSFSLIIFTGCLIISESYYSYLSCFHF